MAAAVTPGCLDWVCPGIDAVVGNVDRKRRVRVDNHNKEPSMANQNLSHDQTPVHGSRRGFAGMDAEKRRVIARKGGQAVSRNRQHMSEIGRRGGVASGGSSRATQAIDSQTTGPTTGSQTIDESGLQ